MCRFLALDDPRTFVPAARFLGIQRRTGVPRVLSLDEGRRFLDACDTLDRRRSSPRRELVLRTLLVLMYLTGLRAGEGLRLTLADVDLETAVLRIRDTKFGKSRLVPVAADVAARLAYCRDTITDELGERTPGEPFFPAPSGQPYSLSALRSAFHAVLVAAEIPRWQGGRSLRLHDLPHYSGTRIIPSRLLKVGGARVGCSIGLGIITDCSRRPEPRRPGGIDRPAIAMLLARDAGKAQFTRVEVKDSGNRRILTRNWVAVNRWSTEERGGQAVSLLWDPPQWLELFRPPASTWQE